MNSETAYMNTETAYMYRKYQKYRQKYHGHQAHQAHQAHQTQRSQWGGGDETHDAQETFIMFLDRLEGLFPSQQTKEDYLDQLTTTHPGEFKEVIEELDEVGDNYYHLSLDADRLKAYYGKQAPRLKRHLKSLLANLTRDPELATPLFLLLAECDFIFKQCPNKEPDLKKVSGLLRQIRDLHGDTLGQARDLSEKCLGAIQKLKENHLHVTILYSFFNFIRDDLSDPKRLLDANTQCEDDEDDDED